MGVLGAPLSCPWLPILPSSGEESLGKTGKGHLGASSPFWLLEQTLSLSLSLSPTSHGWWDPDMKTGATTWLALAPGGQERQAGSAAGPRMEVAVVGTDAQPAGPSR